MYLSSVVALVLITLSRAHSGIHTNDLHPREGQPDSTSVTSNTTPAIESHTPTPKPRKLGHAIVKNNCQFPVYLWSVGTNVQPVQTLEPNTSYRELFREDSNTGGIALKISTEIDGLYTSAPQMVFAYNLSYFRRRGDNGEKVWYDLSDVFGDPFEGFPVSLTPAEPAIHWAEGVPPGGSQVRVVSSRMDLILSLC